MSDVEQFVDRFGQTFGEFQTKIDFIKGFFQTKVEGFVKRICLFILGKNFVFDDK